MPAVSCAVYDCKNHGKKLTELRKQICAKHGINLGGCGCPTEFTHHRFPKEPEMKQRWTILINRKNPDGSLWQPKNDSVVCSIHFIDGKPTDAHPLPTLKLGYTPTAAKIAFREERKTQVAQQTSTIGLNAEPESLPITKHQSSSSGNDGNSCIDLPDNDISMSRVTVKREVKDVNTPEDEIIELSANKSASSKENSDQELNNTTSAADTANKFPTKLARPSYFIQYMHLQEKINKLAPFLHPVHKQLLTNDSKVKFYTNLPSKTVFYSLCNFVKSEKVGGPISKQTTMHQTTLHKFFNINKGHQKLNQLCSKVLPLEDRILLTLMKIRLDLLHQDLCDRFRISLKQVSQVFRETVKLLATAMRPLIVFYRRKEVSRTLPKCYRKNYKNLRCIIDCSEIFIQKPHDLNLQATTWSDYKHHNTVKFLVAITPQGSIAFVSKLWGGRASDRHVVVHSGFLEQIDTLDQVLADRGFPIRDELLIRGAELVIPPGARGRDQMTTLDARETKRVANSRIHVERVIQRIKTNRILSHTVTILLLPLMDDILTICCAIVNLQGPIVASWVEHSQ